MYRVGKNLRAGVTVAVLVVQGSLGTIPPERALVNKTDTSAMTREWINSMLAYGEAGTCHLGSPLYSWRDVGWGSNINQILKSWVYGILQGKHDCALDVTQSYLQQLRCPASANEAVNEVEGWHCIFKPMPRLCTFDTETTLQEHLKGTEQHNIDSDAFVLRPRARGVTKAMVATAVLEFMYSHAQPWFKKDIAAILQEENIAAVRSDRFVAIHVRRGDKLRNEATKVEVSVYLQAASMYVRQSGGGQSGVESISGIWLSSDDSSCLPEVQELAGRYFPNVQMDKIVTISFRDNGPEHPNFLRRDEIPTTSREMTYELYVGFHAELKMMSDADVFVGTYSSNVARLVHLMRESNGLPRTSIVSVDNPEWRLH